jgi:hypothetical protein
MLIVAILAIAYRKELVSLFHKMRENRGNKPIFSEKTIKFFKMFGALALCAGLLIAVFFICINVIHGDAGYFLGAMLDLFLLIAMGMISSDL